MVAGVLLGSVWWGGVGGGGVVGGAGPWLVGSVSHVSYFRLTEIGANLDGGMLDMCRGVGFRAHGGSSSLVASP